MLRQRSDQQPTYQSNLSLPELSLDAAVGVLGPVWSGEPKRIGGELLGRYSLLDGKVSSSYKMPTPSTWCRKDP